MTNPTELAALPATDGHIDRAREAVLVYPAKQSDLETLLASNPTRGQMVDFIGSVRAEATAKQLDQRIDSICKAARIEDPTGAERLMAMQIGLLQDQNTILQSGITRSLNQMRADAEAGESSGTFTALIGGLMVGAVLAR
jgi:hypothetical protein